MKIPFAILFIILSFFGGEQIRPECNETAYRAYLESDNKLAKEQWIKLVAASQEKLKRTPSDQSVLYEITLAQFGLLSSTMRDRDEDLFDKNVDATEENLETLIAGNKSMGESRALLSAVYGFKMAYSPIKGMFLGSKSSGLMDQARKNSPSSPLIWKLYANSKYHTPEAFGGDLKEAIKAYEKAIQLYEAQPGNIKHNWFYIDTIAFLGQAYAKNNQPQNAIAAYEKALKAEPGYFWVKHVLLPKAKNTSARQE